MGGSQTSPYEKTADVYSAFNYESALSRPSNREHEILSEDL